MCSEAKRRERGRESEGRGKEREREGKRDRGREREAGVTVDSHERLARNELAGRPTLNQIHGRVILPSTPLGDRRSPKCPNPLEGVPRLEAQQ